MLGSIVDDIRKSSDSLEKDGDSHPPAVPARLNHSYGRPRNYSFSDNQAGGPKNTVSSSLKSIILSTSNNPSTSSQLNDCDDKSDSTQPKTASVPQELASVVTLLHAQQARCYFEASVEVPTSDTVPSDAPTTSISWYPAYIRLVGTDLTVAPKKPGVIASPQLKRTDRIGSSSSLGSTASSTANSITVANPNEELSPLMINISDAELKFFKDDTHYDIKLQVTNEKCYYLRAENQEDLNYLFAGLLLSQFESKQLQEAFTGALFSSKAITFSDVRTLLDPKNTHPHSEWCIVRFPMLNDKWIRCYVVTIPSGGLKKKDVGKIEIYISDNCSKRNLLATSINGHSAYSLYPENPEYIDTNALVRIWADCYINETLLDRIIAEDEMESVPKPGSRVSSLQKTSNVIHARTVGRSMSRHMSVSSSTTSQMRRKGGHHSRVNSVASVHSLQKMKNLDIQTTNLCYMIPETHGSVPPCETMIRTLIPIMNAFHLYGRPEKFCANRTAKESLLFGFPQLPHTQYLDMQNAFDLVCLNMKNASTQKWSSYEWVEVFREMVHVMISHGSNGSGSIVDVYKDGLLYQKDQHLPETEVSNYDPAEDFGTPSTASTPRMGSGYSETPKSLNVSKATVTPAPKKVTCQKAA